MGLLNVLVMILVVCVVLGLLYWISTLLPLPDPFGRILQVCIVTIGVLIIVLMLLGLIGIGPGVRLGAMRADAQMQVMRFGGMLVAVGDPEGARLGVR